MNHQSSLEQILCLRALDPELKAHCRTMNADFDWKKLSFVLEGKGLMQEEALELAQSKASSAYKKSQVSAFELFKSNLEQDQLLRRRYVQSAVGDESRARAAIVEFLEVGGGVALISWGIFEITC